MLRISALICYLLWDYGFFIDVTDDVYLAQTFVLLTGTIYYGIKRKYNCWQ